MNIILNDSNNSIGGIEVMFIEMTKYLTSNGHNIYFIVNNNSIYEKELRNYSNVFFIRKKNTGLIEFMSSKDIKEESDLILSQLNLKENYYVISPYFQKLQYAMAVFKSLENFKLLNLWPHPQQWAKQLKLIPSNTIIKKIRKTSKYYYQRNLLKVLEEKDAHFYSARAVTVFNNWYYSISLNPTKIETLPIQSIEESPKNFINKSNSDSIKILWCGRFTYFKNEAIIGISKVLSSLAKEFPGFKIEYGIIGFGSEEDTNYIKKNVTSDNITVHFLGKVKPDELSGVFKEYDIGIGMGLTVKKMAQVGLPAIVVDSVEEQQKSVHKENSNWLFDTSEGDAGDGYYYKIANELIQNRQELYVIIKEILKNPQLLEIYSQKCLEYVNNYYSFEKQVQAIVQSTINSKFHPSDFPIYKRNILLRSIYRFYKLIKQLKIVRN